MISLWCGEFYASSSALHCMDCPLDQCGFLWWINQLDPCITLAFICPCCVVVTLPSASVSCSEICSTQLLFRVGMLQFGFGFVCNLFALHFVQACQPENCHGDYSRTFSIALAHSIAFGACSQHCLGAWSYLMPTMPNSSKQLTLSLPCLPLPWLKTMKHLGLNLCHLNLMYQASLKELATLGTMAPLPPLFTLFPWHKRWSHHVQAPCSSSTMPKQKRKRNSTKGGNCAALLHSPKWVPNSTQDEVYGWGAYWLLTYTIINLLGFLST